MKNSLLKSCLLTFWSFSFFSCDSSNSNEPKIIKNISKSGMKAIFDVPSLIGRNIEEIRKELGTPIDKEIEPSNLQKKMKVNFLDNTFEKAGNTLLITFNPINWKVIDFFIGTNDSSGSTIDCSNLFKIYNLTNNNAKYLVNLYL